MHYSPFRDVMQDKLQLQMHVPVLQTTSLRPCSAPTLQSRAASGGGPHRPIDGQRQDRQLAILDIQGGSVHRVKLTQRQNLYGQHLPCEAL